MPCCLSFLIPVLWTQGYSRALSSTNLIVAQHDGTHCRPLARLNLLFLFCNPILYWSIWDTISHLVPVLTPPDLILTSACVTTAVHRSKKNGGNECETHLAQASSLLWECFVTEQRLLVRHKAKAKPRHKLTPSWAKHFFIVCSLSAMAGIDSLQMHSSRSLRQQSNNSHS